MAEMGGTPGDQEGPLKRSLGLFSLVFYGLGTIVGAGIYVLVGAVAGQAGMAAPVAFLLASAAAALTGLSYAELVGRHPEAAGEAAYVAEAFGSTAFSRTVGLALIFVAIIAAASIARGSAGYLQQYVAFPAWAAGGVVVVVLTIVAAVGVRESVRLAVTMALVEIGGLMVVIAAGVSAPGDGLDRLAATALSGPGAWGGVATGAFLAFFAYIGFDTLANMAEEARDVRRNLPRAILLAVALSALFYVAVSAAAVMAVAPERLAAAPAPLVAVITAAGWPFERHFSAIALIATSNGVLIEIILVARLAYGMARRQLLPGFFGAVHPRLRTPVRATLVAGCIVLALVVALPFETLVVATSSIVLLVFVAVNAALWRLQRKDPRPDLAFRAPSWVPPAALLTCLALLAASFFV